MDPIWKIWNHLGAHNMELVKCFDSHWSICTPPWLEWLNRVRIITVGHRPFSVQNVAMAVHFALLSDKLAGQLHDRVAWWLLLPLMISTTLGGKPPGWHVATKLRPCTRVKWQSEQRANQVLRRRKGGKLRCLCSRSAKASMSGTITRYHGCGVMLTRTAEW